MKKYAWVILAISLVGCAPVRIDPLENIDTNETAFVVPLEGASNADQKMFMSMEYLEKAKVATKRVTIPQRYRVTGRLWFDGEWIPTMRVIKVNRAPITREWTDEEARGTNNQVDDSISVQSKDSIGFKVGINITVFVAEENAAKFLYYYAGKPLHQVVDENIRGYVTSILTREFGSRTLEEAKLAKREISDLLLSDCQETYSKMGITVSSLGIIGGMRYSNPEIQKSINDNYVAGMKIQQSENEKLAQVNINAKDLSVAQNARAMAEEFAKAQEAQIAKTRLQIELTKAEAMKAAAEKWTGQMPASVLPQGSNLLFGLDRNEDRK
jgi:regulator of protease activity HflC (stomatin/prohibitin superfamily)